MTEGNTQMNDTQILGQSEANLFGQDQSVTIDGDNMTALGMSMDQQSELQRDSVQGSSMKTKINNLFGNTENDEVISQDGSTGK